MELIASANGFFYFYATDGRYDVRLFYSAHENRASKVPVVVHFKDGDKTVFVNQRTPLVEGKPLSLGVFSFVAGAESWVEIRTTNTDGYVIADAVQFVAVD